VQALAGVLFLFAIVVASALGSPVQAVRNGSSERAAPELKSGEALYQAGCAGCHGASGEGAPETSTGFDRPATFPDFTDCAGTTPELDADWKAIITQGGNVRAFSPIMPSFGEQLTSEQVDLIVKYLRTLCRDRRYPRGELNLPRPMRTEKAFPESETVVTMGTTTRPAFGADAEVGYEHRFTARDQIEIGLPFSSMPGELGGRASGIGDAAFGYKRVLFASHDTIVSGQGEIIAPTGNSDRGLGSGVTTFGAFAAVGRILPSSSFVQFQIGTDQPTSTEKAPRTLFWRLAAGRSFRQANGVGRMWSPMLEVVSDRDFAAGAKTEIDVVPQFQVTLSRRQHVRANVGVELPATNREGRQKQLVFYVLWDWFDGGLFEGWR
jgi:mono/diheme cytochrome c family protein